MAVTINKGFSLQSAGSNPGVWGVGASTALNEGVISIIDNNLGGIVSKSVAGSNITLDATESQMVIVSLTGAQSADIQLTTSCIGFFFVENLTTNAFNITVVNDQISTGVVVPKGRCIVISDASSGCRIASTDSFPTGTRMSFQQSSAPTGWTKDTSTNDAAMRIVNGNASSGGSIGFSVSFAGLVAGTVGGTSLSVSQLPAHTHEVTSAGTRTGSQSANPGNNFYASSGDSGGSYGPKTITSSSVGSGASHTHSFTGTTNLAVKYLDFTIAVKN